MKRTPSPWPLWMGIRGFRIIFHGCWSDPEVVWHDHVMNLYDIEDPMWNNYESHCRETGEETTEEGFERYCKERVDMMRGYAQDTIDCGNARRLQRVRFARA